LFGSKFAKMIFGGIGKGAPDRKQEETKRERFGPRKLQRDASVGQEKEPSLKIQ